MTTLLLTERAGSTYVTCARGRVGVRLLARVRSWTLDTALAGGASPDSSAALSLRARKLIGQTARLRLSHQFRRLLAEAAHPSHCPNWGVSVCRRELLLAAWKLEAVAERLVGSAPVDARGVAQLHGILRDGSSPLYSPTRAGDLEQALGEALDALEPTLELSEA